MKYVYFILACCFIMSCATPLQRELRKHNGNSYVHFEYLNEKEIRVQALQAIWLTAGYPGDTIILNPKETQKLNVPDDEMNITIGNGVIMITFTL